MFAFHECFVCAEVRERWWWYFESVSVSDNFEETKSAIHIQGESGEQENED